MHRETELELDKENVMKNRETLTDCVGVKDSLMDLKHAENLYDRVIELLLRKERMDLVLQIIRIIRCKIFKNVVISQSYY